MEWGKAAAATLLQEAFPWGAHVTVAPDRRFVALQYGTTDDPVDGEEVMLRFDRDPGDTIGRASRTALEKAAMSGRLRLDTGVEVRRPEAADVALLADPLRDLIGPQATGESGWIARMRLHQSWWRTFRLRVPFGYGPTKGSDRQYGNMLDNEGDEAGLNFLSREAEEAYSQRVAATTAGVDRWRTRRNLLASQPMAFNLFGHLSHHLDLASATFRRLLGRDEVDTVTEIEIERLSDALGDRTAFDAFVRYVRPSGAPACLAIETKLTEPFSQQEYNWTTYTDHSAFTTDIWKSSDTTLLGDRRWSQLWRNHLLAQAETTRDPSLGPATLLVVHHPADARCAEAIGGYRSLLVDRNTAVGLDIGRIHQAIADADEQGAHGGWRERFADRYLRLQLSDELLDALSY